MDVLFAVEGLWPLSFLPLLSVLVVAVVVALMFDLTSRISLLRRLVRSLLYVPEPADSVVGPGVDRLDRCERRLVLSFALSPTGPTFEIRSGPGQYFGCCLLCRASLNGCC